MKRVVTFIKSDLFILTIGKIIQMLLLFLAVRLFTNYLSDVEIGNLILILAVTMFFGLALVNPVGSYLNRELNQWYLNGLVLSKFVIFSGYILTVSVIAFGAPYLLALFGVGTSINTLSFSIVVSLFVFFNTWNQTIIPSLNLLFHRKAFVVFTILTVSLYLLLASVFVLLIEPTAYWWLMGQVSGLALGFISAFIYMFFGPLKNQNNLEIGFELKELGKVIRFAMPLSIATLFLWILGNAYKLIIEGQIDAEALAYIGLALILSTSLAGSIESLLMQVFHSSFYKGLASSNSIEDRTIVFQRFVDGTLPIMAGSLFVLICSAGFILTLLVDSRFSVVYQFLMFGLLIEFFRVTANIVSHVAHSEYKTAQNIKPYFYGALVATIGIFIAVQSSQWEYGVIASLLIAWFSTLAIMVRSAKRLIPFVLPIKAMLRVIVYLSPVGLLSVLFSSHSDSLIFSSSFIVLVGVYSSVILYRQYARGIE
ncbi:polysaccharide biosynthesis protein [Thiomicrorhabdus arctica]|uniref:hypothetical protein n=1 Tax=Thiomicrorhabdus arctica TaxID=131540 RepID=UPI00035DE568|nr:hypothetical protein [Thiomicrorhabdus arctica]